jgi:serine/threonine-protein kinase
MSRTKSAMGTERWREIEQLYHAARECEPAERDQFLKKACADEQVRSEVEALLEREEQAESFLEAPALEVTAEALAEGRVQSMLGRVLGHYEIVALLGAGGMGEVYRAVDTRLGRHVAVKISASEFTVRFQRETRAISALNHPHVCTLYDVGPNFLVMELVEGETLAARLKKGKLSIQETLLYGGQIAAAVAEAHSKGIVHRDLKPGNVMISKNGAKVMDFGLAKSPGDGTISQAVMGTPAYMAPEQREGKECDGRTDIYTLGLVLREMATGDREKTTLSLSKTGDLPPQFAHLIERCVADDPDARWQSARDVKAELDWIRTHGTEVQSRSVSSRPSRRPWALATLAVAVAVGGWWYATRPAPLRPLIRLNLDIPADTPLARGEGPNAGGILALSPDASRLVLTLRDPDGKIRLHTRLLDQNQFTRLMGTENAYFPFFSPDGEWIGFFANFKLKKIPVQGGAVVVLCDAPFGRGANWGEDGNIIGALTNGAVSRIPSSGGTPVLVTKLNAQESTHRWPQLLPGGHAVMFTASSLGANFDAASIDVVSLENGARKTAMTGGFFARYIAAPGRDGYLVYLRQSTLLAVPFDLGRLSVTGTPVPILDDVGNNRIGGGDFAFNPAPAGSGTFVYLPGKGGYPISWLDAAGKTEPLNPQPAAYATPRFSPDGKRLAFGLISGNQGEDLWVKDLDRDAPTRLTFLSGTNRFPVWTPDGKNIIFNSTDLTAPGLYWVPADGSGQAQRLLEGGKVGQPYPYSISPDGKHLAYALGATFIAPIESDSGRLSLGKPEPFMRTPFAGAFPAFSPDGHWLAYASVESGMSQVYVRPFPGPGGRWQISTAGGTLPVWSHDGRQLFFETLDQHVMRVSYSARGDSFASGKPEPWSQAQLQPMLGSTFNYDVAPDGKRLAALLAGGGAANEKPATQLTVLLNFSDEIRRRMAASKAP